MLRDRNRSGFASSLVGRDRELRRLQLLARTAGAGEPIVLAGPSGCGKSALVQTLVRSLAGEVAPQVVDASDELDEAALAPCGTCTIVAFRPPNAGDGGLRGALLARAAVAGTLVCLRPLSPILTARALRARPEFTRAPDDATLLAIASATGGDLADAIELAARLVAEPASALVSPRALREVGLQWAQLDQFARAVLTTAVALGDGTPCDDLGAAMRCAAAAIEAALATLEACGLLAIEGDLLRAPTPTIRSALAELAVRPSAPSIHARIAERLEGRARPLGDQTLRLLAEQCALARDRERATIFGCSAATRAIERGEFAAAVEIYRRLIGLGGSPETLATFYDGIAFAQRRLGDFAGSRTTLERALDLCSASRERDVAVRLWHALAYASHYAFDSRAADAALGRMRESIEAEGASYRRFRAEVTEALFAGDAAQVARMRCALACAEEHTLRSPELAALRDDPGLTRAQARLAALVADPEERAKASNRSIVCGDRAGRASGAAARLWRSIEALHEGALASAQTTAATALILAESGTLPVHAAAAHALLAECALEAGRLPLARTHLEQALRRRTPADYRSFGVALQLAAWTAGEPQWCSASEGFDERIWRDGLDPRIARFLEGRVLALVPVDPEGARRLLERFAGRCASSFGALGLFALAAMIDDRQARERVRGLLVNEASRTPRARAELAEFEGSLAAREGKRARARQLYLAAARCFDELGFVVRALRARAFAGERAAAECAAAALAAGDLVVPLRASAHALSSMRG